MADKRAQNGKVEQSLLKTLKETKNANIMVTFVGGNRPALDSIEGQVFTDRSERLNALNQALKSLADKSQRKVQKFLNEKSIPFHSLFISNQISIKGAELEIVLGLSDFEEVETIRMEQTAVLLDN